ncbi:MAG: alpha-1,2-fucosyltransferase [Lachnospiraceae bacterium]|nr:alpha-1,2-fucosyltransferase [Lachnospiraceae bacterium]
MYIQRFTSGLGNQMFQYAFYTYLRKRYPEERILADISWYSFNSAHQGFELEKLFRREDNPDFVFEKAGLFEVYCCSGALPRSSKLNVFINRVTRLCAGRHFERNHISETGREKENTLKARIDNLPKGRNLYITGYFLDEAYYKDDLPKLRSALSFSEKKEVIGEENEQLLREIREGGSLCIHVRRGDYLNPGYTEDFINLGMDYYKKAVDMAREKYGDPRIYIFSDDKDFITTAFDWIPEKTPVTLNSGDRSYIDMLLMSKAKCLITANSTFSEWAGLLNERADNMIIYPKEYLKEKDSFTKTIPGWVRL